jgi:spermidine synthase
MKVDVDVPDGVSGVWAVETFTVSKQDADLERLRSMFVGRGRHVPEGTYKRLSRGGSVIMSNTPDEILDLYSFYYRAKGNILINGLGLGVALKMILQKPEVKSVCVVEQSEDVYKLVGPTYEKDPRVKIFLASAFDFAPRCRRYDAVWHDIWDNITSDNLEEMKRLHRKYGRRADWQGSWCRERCEMHQEREKVYA